MEYKDETFWVADDGSYGYGWIATFSKANWSDEQHAWLERYLAGGNDPDMDVIEGIDNGDEPEWDDD
jgi:hypothetical protein